MLPLHGVIYSVHPEANLKQQALLFDQFRVIDMRGKAPLNRMAPVPESWDFLEERGFVEMVPSHLMEEPLYKIGMGPAATRFEIWDAFNRAVAAYLSTPENNVVPFCRDPLPERFRDPLQSVFSDDNNRQLIMNLMLDHLPAPSEDTPWQDILDFKKECHDKEWAFRRFLKKLSSTQQTKAEINDEIEWLLHQYSEAMRIHRIKSTQSFVDVFIITPLEVLETL
jgi:hypothetical protein